MKTAKSRVADIRAEYKRSDLGAGVRGKFYAQYQKGHNLVLLKPDVAAAFPTDAAVNEALMFLVRIARATRRPTRRSSGRVAKSRRAPLNLGVGHPERPQRRVHARGRVDVSCHR
jgi:hypothetical protein